MHDGWVMHITVIHKLGKIAEVIDLSYQDGKKCSYVLVSPNCYQIAKGHSSTANHKKGVQFLYDKYMHAIAISSLIQMTQFVLWVVKY